MRLMVILTLMISILFSNQDSILVVEYYMSGKVKTQGFKINKFKHGDWNYYDNKGLLLKTEKWYHGKKTKTFDMSMIRNQSTTSDSE